MKKDSSLILPCLRGVMGNWVFYSSLMTAKQVKAWIKPAKEIREAKALDELLQRDLKDRRKSIAKYLLSNSSRFFNSLVVGVFDGVPDWLEFDFPEMAGGVIVPNTGVKDSMGLMILRGNEKMFAIDGQHRVAGIEIAVQEDTKKPEDKQILKDDQFSVILVAHIDDDLGRKRTRKLFSDINKHAKPVAEGDKIKIDEEDICAIVTRRIYANSAYFKKGKLISLTETAKLDPKDDQYFTNLLALYRVNKKLRPLFKKIRGVDIWEEENIKGFLSIVEEFYDFAFKTIAEYKKYFIEKNLTLKEARKENKYLLFRPVGLVLVARLYAHFKKIDQFEILKKNINKIGFIMPNSPYHKVLWDNGKMEAKIASQTIAFNLTRYLLNNYPKGDVPNLLNKYREITKNDAAQLPNKIVN